MVKRFGDEERHYEAEPEREAERERFRRRAGDWEAEERDLRYGYPASAYTGERYQQDERTWRSPEGRGANYGYFGYGPANDNERFRRQTRYGMQREQERERRRDRSWRPANEEYNRGWGEADYDTRSRIREATEADQWLVPGPFTGVGPRGYRRSDERIQEDVCDLLMRHGQIDASEIEVEVSEGEVTLRGTVPDRWVKGEVENVVDVVSGVRDVHNRLRVSEDIRSEWEPSSRR